MFAVVSKEVVKNVNTEKTHKMVSGGVYVFLFQIIDASDFFHPEDNNSF